MAIARKLRNHEVGGSTLMVIPAAIEKGSYSSIAGNRILLVDPRGELDPKELLEFMEDEVEYRFWEWLNKKKKEEST